MRVNWSYYKQSDHGDQEAHESPGCWYGRYDFWNAHEVEGQDLPRGSYTHSQYSVQYFLSLCDVGFEYLST